ncbi:MAG: hypothetical protein IJR18_05220 [Campylobacter sp.]|nr:hypothetical protein [Campylobacter sp.]
MKKVLIILSVIAIGGIIGYFYAEYENKKENKENLKYTNDPNAYMDVIIDWEIDNTEPKAQNAKEQKQNLKDLFNDKQQNKQKIQIEIN